MKVETELKLIDGICWGAIILIFLAIISVIIISNREMEQIEVGDRFEVEYKLDENPFIKPIKFGGTIIAKEGDYIQYIEDNGDTSSCNYRIFMDCGEFKLIR